MATATIGPEHAEEESLNNKPVASQLQLDWLLV